MFRERLTQAKELQKQLVSKIKKEHSYVDQILFRHRHIAYCLVRGRPYDCIEKPKKENVPNRAWVGHYYKGLSGLTHPDFVCACNDCEGSGYDWTKGGVQ